MSYIVEIVFLGTGTSGCVPNIYCLTAENPTCQVCLSTERPVHASSLWKECKNKRRNTSIIVRYWCASKKKVCNIVVDCGKTFYTSALQWMVKYKLREITGCFLTHGHADAMFGLDDLRQWTIGGAERAVQPCVDIYLCNETYNAVRTTFPYLVDRSMATGGGDVPSLRYHQFDSNKASFDVHGGFKVVPLPVNHGFYSSGEPYMSNGFRFGSVVYISDVSFIPTTTLQKMHGCDVLILDGLGALPHASHFSIAQSLLVGLVHQPLICPRLVLLTDFCHSVDHDALERELQRFKAHLEVELDVNRRTRLEWNGKYVKFSRSDAELLHRVLYTRDSSSVPLKIPTMRPAWDGMRAAFAYNDAMHELPGWNCSVSNIPSTSDLPEILVSESF